MPDGPRRRWLMAAALVVAFKAVYFVEYAALPFLRGPIIDSLVYRQQAERVAAGQFGDATLLAFSPLYGYFLALVGNTLVLPILAQFLLGCFCLVLVHHVARERFGSRAALISAGLFFGYGPLLFYESKILSETLGMTLALGALAFYLSPSFEQGRARTALAAGALFGLAILARASLLFSGVLLVAASPWPWSRRSPDAPPLGARLRRTAGLAAGFALMLGAHGAWTKLHSGLFVPVILVSKTVGNATATQWSGKLSALSPDGSGSVTAWDVVRQAQAQLRRRGEPEPAAPERPLWGIDVAGFLRNLPSKLATTLSDTETSFDYGYYGERSEVRALWLLPVTFGALLVLGLVGAIALVRRAGVAALVPILPLALGALAVTTLFHPSTRYRLPFVLPLVLLGGVGLAAAWETSNVRLRAAAGAALALVLVGFALKAYTYQLKNPALWHLRVAQSAAMTGDIGEVRDRISRARSLAPHDDEVRRRTKQVLDLAGSRAPMDPRSFHIEN